MNVIAHVIGDISTNLVTFPPESLLDIGLVVGGLIIAGFGIVVARFWWTLRKTITIAETMEVSTSIQDIDSRVIDSEMITELTDTTSGTIDRGAHQPAVDPMVELSGTISGPVDDSEFISPISQTEEIVFVKWAFYEFERDGEDSSPSWQFGGSGVYSVPFYLDDGHDRIQVSIGEQSQDVGWCFGDPHVTEFVSEDADPPIDPTALDNVPNLEGHVSEERAGGQFVQRPSYKRDSTVGERYFVEWPLGPGDEIHLTGVVHAPNGGPLPRYSKNMIVTPDRFGDMPLNQEDTVDGAIHLGSWFGHCLAIASGGLVVISVLLLIAGLTTVL